MRRNDPMSNNELIVKIVIAIALSVGFVLAFVSAFAQSVTITIPSDTSKVEVVEGTEWLIMHNSKARKLIRGYEDNKLNKQKFEECEVYVREVEEERDTCKFNNSIYRDVITACDGIVTQINLALDDAEKECDKKMKKHKFLSTLKTIGGAILVGAIIVLVII